MTVNFVICGSDGSGKSTLAKAFLKLGKLPIKEDIDNFIDYEPESKKRLFTVSNSFYFMKYKDKTVDIVDTPGFTDFIYETFTVLRYTDLCLIVLKDWDYFTNLFYKQAKKLGLSVIFVLNLHEKQKKDEILKKIKNVTNFVKVSDIVDDKVLKLGEFEDSDEYIEELALVNEELLDKFFEKGLENQEIQEAIKLGLYDSSISPLLFVVDALNSKGVKELLDFICELDFGKLTTNTFKRVTNKDLKEIQEGCCCAVVVKNFVDHYAGVLSVVRVFGKSNMEPNFDMTLFRNNKAEFNFKAAKLYKVFANKYLETDSIQIGSFGALAKLKDVRTFDVINKDKCEPIEFDVLDIPKPVLYYAMLPKTSKDENNMLSSLEKIALEDHTIQIIRDKETSELLLGTFGQVQTDVILEKLKRKFNVSLDTKLPEVKYRETITKSAKAQGKYKKQTGGRGQYGDAWLEISPLRRGEGFVFESKIVGGVIPKQYIPAVEKGVKEAMEQGFLKGYKMVDIKVVVFDGSYHEVDSSELAFKIAASMGFKKALQQANVVMLEPIYKLTITIPESVVGDVIGDLNSRRAKILSMDMKEGNRVIVAHVPYVEILNYANVLQAKTKARCFYQQEFDHYEIVPPNLVDKIPSKLKEGE